MGFFSSILDFLFGVTDDEVDEETLSQNQNKQEHKYEKKKIMSEYEKYFYDILTENFSRKYFIMPQVNLASIINKEKNFPTEYQNELYRNIDFGIFDKNTMEVKLLIEINDKTHRQARRAARDIKVKDICEAADIKLITFYTNYPNKKEYVVDRIKNNLK